MRTTDASPGNYAPRTVQALEWLLRNARRESSRYGSTVSDQERRSFPGLL